MNEASERVRLDGGVAVGDDGSDCAANAVRYAAEDARRRRCPLHVVRGWLIATAVRPEGLPYGSVASLTELGEATQAAEEARVAELLGPDPGIEVHVHALHAPAAQAMLSAAEGADLLVLGARGRGGFRSLLLGSTAAQVVQHASCPVTVVKL